MDFPITELMDEDACYAKLVEWLHPDGLACPRCHEADRMIAHRRHLAPILEFRCGHCGRVFNAFTGTILHGLRRRPRALVLIVRGIAQGVPTAQLALELDCDRSEWLELRHRLQDAASRNRDRTPLDDEVREADEMDQNAGEKRRAAPRPRRPTAASCQPTTRPWPLCGVVGRESEQVRLTVVEHSDSATLQAVVRRATWPMATVHPEEWPGYNCLPTMGRDHATVCHAAGEWTRDDDGDGIRGVHTKTLEGLWTGLRNFLRPFRGVHKEDLYPDAAIFEWG